MHFFRKTADVVVALDDLRRISGDGNTLNHIGIERALRKKSITAVLVRVIFTILRQQFFGRVLKYFDEFVPDNLALLFRVGDAPKFEKKSLGSVHILQANM